MAGIEVNMKYFKDIQNQVYAYEADGSQDAFIAPGLTPITSAEADALRAAAVITTVPTIITMRQARLALLQGGYLASVEALMAAMPGDSGAAARIHWEFADTVERTHYLVTAMASELPLTETEIDDLFILGASL